MPQRQVAFRRERVQTCRGPSSTMTLGSTAHLQTPEAAKIYFDSSWSIRERRTEGVARGRTDPVHPETLVAEHELPCRAMLNDDYPISFRQWYVL